MGLDLSLVPEIVRPLALPLTGGAFPETDVDGVIAEAQVLENLADLLATIKSDDAAAVVRSLRDHQWQGAAKETFEQVFKMLGGQPDADGTPSDETLIDLLEKGLREEAASLREHGVRMQHTEWMIYASLALLGAMIVKLLVWIYVNGPAVLRLIQHNTLLTQVNIQTLKRLMLVNMLKFAGIMGGLDFGVQVAQQIWGDREAGDFDLASLAMSVGSGALTGALFAGANAALSRLLSRRMVYVASEAELAVRDKIAAIAQSMYGQALLGGVAGTAGAVPGLAISGQLDGEHLAYTFIAGVAGGLDIPAAARVSHIPMRAVAELGDTPSATAPHADPPPTSGGEPPLPSSPALPSSPRPVPHDTAPLPVPHDAASPPVLHDAAPRLAGHDTTTLAQHHPRPDQHADVATLINRRPSEPGTNLPQPHQGQVIVGEVTRRHDVLLHSPAEQGGPLARPQQNLPAARAPIGDTAPAVPRAEPATPGSLPHTSLLPATVPAIITPTPDGAAEQDNHHQTQDSPPAETAPAVQERHPDDSAPLPRVDGDPPVTGQPTTTPHHASTDLQGGQTVVPRSSPLPENPRRIEPVSHQADVWPASRESLENVWVPVEEVPALNLHPDLARAWPDVRTELDRVLAAPDTRPRPPHPANTHEMPGLPDTDGFSPIADPRPRNFAEAAATVHRWSPGNDRPHQNGPHQNGPHQGGPHQNGPPNRIEHLLSNPPAAADDVLLAEGRRLVEELPVIDGSDTTARALASMSRTLNWPNPRRALHDLASELGLNLDLDALVEVYENARGFGMNPDGATGRTGLVDALRAAMAADSYRWTGQHYQARFSLPEATPAQARTIGLMVEMMGEPVTSAKVRNFVKPVLDRHGIGDVRELLPVVRAAHEKGYLPAGTTGEAEFRAAMDLFWQDDPYLWNGVLLADRYSLPELRDPTARLSARLEEIVAHSGRDTVPPLEGLAGDLGLGRSAEQLVRLAADAQANGADLARAADRQDLVGRLAAYRARDPYLWDGLRIAAERGLTGLSNDEARILSRLAEIIASESPSRMWVFDPLRRLAGDAGHHHSVEQLVRHAAVGLPHGVDPFGPLDRQRVLDVLGTNAVVRPDPQQVPPGLHDLSPAAVRDARQAAVHAHAQAKEAFHQSSLRRTVSRLVGQDPLVVARQEMVASLEARTRAWQRWPDRPEVSFTGDFAAYRHAYDQAVQRAVRGEAVIPYMRENATASLGARDGGRGFGVEIEFELPKHNARQALQAIARALHKAGLVADARVDNYHTMRDEGYRSGKNGGRGLWRLEQDGTVDGELISPILYDESATWENLLVATEIIRAHGGTAGASTGGHVHVSTHDFDHIVENYTSLLNHGGLHTDTLFRLGHNPERESHRGVAQCKPNRLPTEGYRSIAPVRNLNGRKSAVNMESMKGTAKDHVEWRLWDGSLDPAVIQSRVKVSLAEVEAAFRTATLGQLPNLGRLDQLGAHAELLKLDPGLDLTEQGSLSFRVLMDELFWRAADKEQLTALFAATRWVPAA
ncbi:amidoligase family protein [Nonomuraea sp. NPDC052116]|uniref:amidoligase family protein n=1 Tax=Nonomuraea sp. NPDC052116 TaxID=3155665 RepID=UPI00342D083D